MNRGLVTIGVSAWACALACAPTGAAEPTGPAPGPQPVPTETASASGAVAASELSGGSPVADGCSLFDAALNVAAANYEDFAYATAGNGNQVDYQDPEVGRTNVIGRTALRQAAAAAMSASRTPDLPEEVSDPMRTWSLHATKLLVVMGLRGGGDSLNSSAVELNNDAHDVQMACAVHGAQQ